MFCNTQMNSPYRCYGSHRKYISRRKEKSCEWFDKDEGEKRQHFHGPKQTSSIIFVASQISFVKFKFQPVVCRFVVAWQFSFVYQKTRIHFSLSPLPKHFPEFLLCPISGGNIFLETDQIIFFQKAGKKCMTNAEQICLGWLKATAELSSLKSNRI